VITDLINIYKMFVVESFSSSNVCSNATKSLFICKMAPQ